eukprot:5440799-Amphidinium_carterae.1
MEKENTGMQEDGRTVCYRALCIELFSAVAALGSRKIFIIGDRNFEPDELPIDLVRGSQVNRPLMQ